ncbi:dienelactone hydrolase family protein [Spongiactinospora rosea]|uniref:Dienelactone hydrolase family protein n=1 Tax=Spongiactinospora rosea TaxID=2248750 RepID=A0A366LL46_9ACTN|nr:dienelactone hydrolase family protein [Spongiactinospora rosea]RBQ14547.1 dienelactone hydrolase family protein [Spongiactinospora rosea]
MTTRTERVTVSDGAFDMPVWLPASGRGPGILLIQEVWGVGPYIRKVGEDLAALGYVVGAPELFWRLHEHWEGAHDDAGLAASLDLASRFDFERGVEDSAAALGHLRGLPEVAGRAGTFGICLGGSIGYMLGARGLPDAVVAFYGSAIPDATDLMDSVRAPLLCVFGGSDPYIPRDKVAKVEEAAAGRPGVEVRVYEKAGHAFHNHLAPRFHDPEYAPRAWEAATTFLSRHLPVT